MNFNMDRKRVDSKEKEKIIEELKTVFNKVGKRYYGRREYDKYSVYCKGSTVIRYFGSWETALQNAGIESKPNRRIRKDKILELDLLIELMNIWEKLGHRPSKDEWLSAKSKYSYTTYKRTFGGWINACEKVLEYIGNDQNIEETQNKENTVEVEQDIILKKTRSIPLKIKLQVLKRDNYKCCFCGKSPALNAGTILHIDHIIPFSKNGKSDLSNLRVLCSECNLGRGNDETL
jgi:hypothetical protein